MTKSPTPPLRHGLPLRLSEIACESWHSKADGGTEPLQRPDLKVGA